MIFNINNELIQKYLFSATFGMEKESLRIDKNGNLSKTPHPFTDKHFERDFSENQLEIITDVFDSTEKVYQHLYNLQKQASNALAKLNTGREYLWCFSNPPYVKDDADIPIANYKGEKLGYRKYLSKKYGKRKMLFSGVHFNFSFGEALLKTAFDLSDYSDFTEFKNSVYLELAEKLLKYSHIIAFLTCASPVVDSSFNNSDLGKTITTKYTSVRCSEKGYWNNFTPVLDYTGLDNYINSIETYIKSGELLSVKELYYPIRLKPIGDNTLENLKDKGVNHVELRMLDVNPLSVAGFMKEDMDFIHLLIVYLMVLPQEVVDQEQAINNLKNSMCIENLKDLSLETLTLLDNMENMFKNLKNKDILQAIDYQRHKISNNKLYSTVIAENFSKDYVKKGIILAKRYAKMLED